MGSRRVGGVRGGGEVGGRGKDAHVRIKGIRGEKVGG